MERIQISRRRSTTRSAAPQHEQAFPVPPAELATSTEDVSAVLAHIDSALASD
jgi:hypothetical protein